MMKRTALFSFLSLFLLAGFGLKAQTGPYARLGVGYSMGTTGEVLGTKYVEDANGNFTESNIYGTYGNGANFRLNVGYNLSQNFGFDLGIDYLLGSKVTDDEYSDPSQMETSETYTRQFRLAPSFIVRASNEGMVQPYGGLGLLIPVTGTTTNEVSGSYTGISGNYTQKTEATGQFSLGYEAFAGAYFKVPNDKVRIFAELRYSGLRIKGKEAELVEYMDIDPTQVTTNMVDYIELGYIQNRKYEFVDEVNQDTNANNNAGDPIETLGGTTNFSSFTIQVGVAMSFGGDEE